MTSRRSVVQLAGKALLRPRSEHCLTSKRFRSEKSEQKDGDDKAWTVWKFVKGLASNRIVMVGGGGLVLLAVNSSVDSRIERYYKGKVYQRVAAGFCPIVKDDEDTLPRDEQRKRLRELLVPDRPSKFYHVVYGHRGNGKSTLLRAAVREAGGGVGYVAPEPVGEADFGRTLGAALDFNFEEHRNLVNGLLSFFAPGSGVDEDVPALGALMRTARALDEAAREYRVHHAGRPFVLVVDDADRLARDSPKALAALQEYAKEWADQQLVTLVFVASERSTLRALQAQRAWSRAFEPTPLPGLTTLEAREYLQRRGVPSEAVEPLVEIASDDMQALDKAALLLRRGLSLDEVRDRTMRGADQHYAAAGLLDATPQQRPGLKAIDALLGSGEVPPAIPVAEWRRIVPSPDLQEELQKSNILTADDECLRFGSRVAHAYAQHLLRSRLSPDVPFAG